jgi:hypothetical protein
MMSPATDVRCLVIKIGGHGMNIEAAFATACAAVIAAHALFLAAFG